MKFSLGKIRRMYAGADREVLLWGGGLFLVTLVLYYIFISPQAAGLKAVHVQYQNQRILISERLRMVNEFESLKQQNDELQAELAAVDRKFVSEAGVTELQNTLSRLADGTHNHLEEIGILKGTESGKGAIREVKIRLELTGRFDTLHDFLTRLYEQDTFLLVNELALSGDEGSPELDLSFVLTCFYQVGHSEERS